MQKALISILVLAWAATAGAECGYVFWHEMTRDNLETRPLTTSVNWILIGTYSSPSACEAGMQAKLSDWSKDKAYKINGNTASWGVEGKFHYFSRLVCSPGTIDPRPPSLR